MSDNSIMAERFKAIVRNIYNAVTLDQMSGIKEWMTRCDEEYGKDWAHYHSLINVLYQSRMDTMFTTAHDSAAEITKAILQAKTLEELDKLYESNREFLSRHRDVLNNLVMQIRVMTLANSADSITTDSEGWEG